MSWRETAEERREDERKIALQSERRVCRAGPDSDTEASRKKKSETYARAGVDGLWCERRRYESMSGARWTASAARVTDAQSGL